MPRQADGPAGDFSAQAEPRGAPSVERCLLHSATTLCENGVCHRCKPSCNHAPSVGAVLREVERRLREGREPEEVDGLITQVFYVGEVARMLVAAARCQRCDGKGVTQEPLINAAEASELPWGCTMCGGSPITGEIGTGIDPTRLDAALKAGGA